jgi:pantoate--beta-alanine ligase
MSSRNQYLQGDERQAATLIYQTLRWMREQCGYGLPLDRIEDEARQRLTMAGFDVDYAEVRRADLARARAPDEPLLLALIAARLGRTRLIDNLEFDAG